MIYKYLSRVLSTVYRYNILLEYSKDEQSSTDSRNKIK